MGRAGRLLIASAASIVALSQALPTQPCRAAQGVVAGASARRERKPLVEAGKQALKQPAPVAAAERIFEHPLRVRHHAEDAPRSIANAGDVALRAIGVGL